MTNPPDLGRGARTARRVLSELGVDDPTEFEIETLAFARGALVHQRPLAGCQGRLVRVGSKAIISVSTSIEYPARRRWVIAHELGHLELHPDRNQLDLCTSAVIDERYDQGPEREANAFAAEFLMPENMWIDEVDVKEPSLDVVKELSEYYQVSLVAAAIRFVKLSNDRVAVVFSKANRAEWFARSKDFGCFIEIGDPLSRHTLASDFFTKGTVSVRPEQVSASGWLSGKRVRSDSLVVEHCRPIRSLAATLSLLWIRPDASF